MTLKQQTHCGALAEGDWKVLFHKWKKASAGCVISPEEDVWVTFPGGCRSHEKWFSLCPEALYLQRVCKESKAFGCCLGLLFSCSVVSDFCDPMSCSTPGLPVLHHLPEFAQTRVHRVGDAIQSSHPPSPPSPPAPSPSQRQGLSQRCGVDSTTSAGAAVCFLMSPFISLKLVLLGRWGGESRGRSASMQ